VPVGQTALLTVGRARETVQIVDGRFVARTMMWATVNLDHREFDGADGAVLLEAFARACSITLNDPLAQR
jgi:pyruvate dehydrogenase E2 component (dihydrolipoamide acetyltransferase)